MAGSVLISNRTRLLVLCHQCRKVRIVALDPELLIRGEGLRRDLINCHYEDGRYGLVMFADELCVRFVAKEYERVDLPLVGSREELGDHLLLLTAESKDELLLMSMGEVEVLKSTFAQA